ncbi:YgcG family protein [Providencia vermicola]|uniref:TPM domain-containing protein n=1 Tax=Providencia vermicola TaxID=333965 RepID=A0AAX3RVD9_9GAMM|nr:MULTISPECIES: TPM domain-containing protein [Providencia]ELX8379915.1 TPM domain-containing protein [Providencia stuartii]EMD5259304.1 TPM domain-containing protein [Providencia stuartii]USB37694.1 TPM domain-containing protein [Providencia vermicola]WFC06627.1 TPM domain-containing protein [Providencia vermicola]
MKYRHVIWLLLFCVLSSGTWATQHIPLPALGSDRVLDHAGLLSESQYQTLNNQLLNFEKQRGDGTQFVVYIVPTTAPETIEQFSLRAFNRWGLGKKGKNNGILLVVSLDDRNVRFEVGYGYEGVMTDALSGRIIRQSIIPNFKHEHYYTGIQNSVSRVINVINEAVGYQMGGSYGGFVLPKSIENYKLFYFISFITAYFTALFYGTKQRRLYIEKKIYRIAYADKSKRARANQQLQLAKLKKYHQYKYYFPSLFSTLLITTLYYLALMLLTTLLEGRFDLILLLLMALFCVVGSMFATPIILVVIHTILPAYRQQQQEWNDICRPYYSSSFSSSDFSSSSSSSSSSSDHDSGGGGGGSSGGGGASGHW